MPTRTEQVLAALGIEGRRRGTQIFAKCPNKAHDDRNPSWRIRDEPGSKRDGYHACPPCGFEGGIIGLIAYVRGVTFKEAGKLLHDIEEGLGLQLVEPPARIEFVTRRRGFNLPVGIVVEPVDKWPRMAREYALSPPRELTTVPPYGRGLTREQVERWRIGYADEGRLAHRLVLVTRDENGIAWNYTGRTYADHPKRYFEPEHWERADRNVMFGEERWSKTGFDCVVVTEGGFKALAVERVDSDVALAATSGSAIMPGYPLKLCRFDHVIVSTDADDAGDRIADELMFMLKKQRQRCTRMRLRDKTEHDTIPKEELRELLEQAKAS